MTYYNHKKQSILNSSPIQTMNERHSQAVRERLSTKVYKLTHNLKSAESFKSKDSLPNEDPYQLTTFKYLTVKEDQNLRPKVSLRRLIKCGSSEERYKVRESSPTSRKIIYINEESIPVTTSIDQNDLLAVQTETSLFIVPYKNEKHLERKQNLFSMNQPVYNIFSYSPGKEKFSASPQSKKIIEKNRQFIHSPQTSNRKSGNKVDEIKIALSLLPKNFEKERGRMTTKQSQRYAQKNKDLIIIPDDQTFFKNLDIKKSTLSLKKQKIIEQKDLIVDLGGKENILQLIEKIVQHFMKFQSKKSETRQDSIILKSVYLSDFEENKIDYNHSKQDIINFLYSLYDNSFNECLQSFLMDGQDVRIAFIKSFFRARRVNEIKYSAFKFELELILQKEKVAQQIICTILNRADEYQSKFTGDSWFEIYGGEKALRALLQDISQQQLIDGILAHIFSTGQAESFINIHNEFMVKILVQSLIRFSQPQQKLNIISNHKNLTITFIEFYQYKVHFRLALRRQRQSPICINLMLQVIEKFRYLLIQPEPESQIFFQDESYLKKFILLYKTKVLKIYGMSQLYSLINDRVQFYDLIQNISEKYTIHLIKDLVSKAKINNFECYRAMQSELNLIVKSKNFWNMKDCFIETFNELCNDVHFRHGIQQAFDNMQIYLGLTSSIFIDIFKFAYSTEIYKIHEKIQHFVVDFSNFLSKETNIHLIQERLHSQSLGESIEYILEWVLQFLCQLNPTEATVPFLDMKAFLLINQLDLSYLQNVITQLDLYLMNKVYLKNKTQIIKSIKMFAQQHLSLVMD